MSVYSSVVTTRESAYFEAVGDKEVSESREHTYCIEPEDGGFRAVVPAPLSEFSLSVKDEVSAWVWLIDLRENHVSGRLWDISDMKRCSQVIHKALAGLIKDDCLQEGFLHLPAGTNDSVVWEWYYRYFDLHGISAR